MKKSFSLIELLIVVTIIAVLTGAALPFVGEYLEQAKVAKAKNDLDEISRAINAFEVTTGQFYTDTTGNVLKGRFLQKLPIDPWGTPYSFASATEGFGATVYSAGSDHISGNSDDIIANYKGPLAIVSVKWVDNNQDGAISGSSSAFPASDTFILRFNRQATNTIGVYGVPAAETFFGISSGTFADYFATGSLQTDGRTVIWQLASATNLMTKPFTIGSDSVIMTTLVTDAANNPGVPASVTILAQ